MTIKSHLSLLAMLALGAGASAVPRHAEAADLGGGCCGDLEERIADLEATAARKGTRKVTLTISGYVAQEITWWDDGGERNVYLHGLGPTQATNFRLGGQAQISPEWSAGYLMRLQNLSDNPFGRNGSAAFDQESSELNQGLNVQLSYWYLQSKTLGRVSVGKQMNAAKSAAMFTDQSGTQIFDNYTFLDGFPQMRLRDAATGSLLNETWANLAFCYSQGVPLGGDCNGLVMSAVRYDTPVLAGFSASASWGTDDFWEIAARYAGEISGFKLALGVGYSDATDETVTVALPPESVKSTTNIQAGAYVQHVATGLFAHVAYGREDNSDTRIGAAALVPPDSQHWYTKAGIRQNWNGLGATIIYGDYASYQDQIGPGALALGATGGELKRYGGGIAQELDAAATTLYLKYQRYEGKFTGAALDPRLDTLEDIDFVSAGAIVNF